MHYYVIEIGSYFERKKVVGKRQVVAVASVFFVANFSSHFFFSSSSSCQTFAKNSFALSAVLRYIVGESKRGKKEVDCMMPS